MNLLKNLLQQAAQVFDNVDFTGIIGILYCVFRARRCLRGKARQVAGVMVLPAAYFLVITATSLLADTPVAERYYRPVLPFFLVISAVGLFYLLKDLRKPILVVPVLALLVGGNLMDMLDEPIRAHRAEQTRAGKFLNRHDPHYDGYVLSDYSQPAYYADMEYLPASPAIMRLLSRTGREPKYAIMEREFIRVGSEGEGATAGVKGASLVGVQAATGSLSINHNWLSVKLLSGFNQPPVIITSPPTYHGGDPGVVRLRRTTQESFDIRYQECAYLDDKHVWEDVRWLAVEPGRHTVRGTLRLAASTVEVKAHEADVPQRVEFGDAFPRKPIVLATVQTNREDHPVIARICSVDRRGFSVFLQQEEVLGPPGSESVGFVAVDGSVEQIGGLRCRAGRVREELERGKTIIIGEVSTGLRALEERSADKETQHKQETIGLLSLGGHPLVLADTQTCREVDFVMLRVMPLGGEWMQRYVKKNKWKAIYHEPDRNLYIYQNPLYGRTDGH